MSKSMILTQRSAYEATSKRQISISSLMRPTMASTVGSGSQIRPGSRGAFHEHEPDEETSAQLVPLVTAANGTPPASQSSELNAGSVTESTGVVAVTADRNSALISGTQKTSAGQSAELTDEFAV